MEKDAITEFYDQFASKQIASGVNERHHRIRDLAAALGNRPGMRILEMGCGIGTVTGLLAEAFSDGKILAIDLSPASIEQARKRLATYKNTEVMVADMIGSRIEGRFDLVVLPDVLEHIPEHLHSELFLRLKELLAEEGHILIHSPEPHYSDWLRKKRPETMQVIDLALHLPPLMLKIHDAGLTISKMERHRIWADVPDYMYLVLVHAPTDHEFTIVETPTPNWIGRAYQAFIRRLG